MTNEIDLVRRHWTLSAQGASAPWEELTGDPAGVDYREVDAGGTGYMANAELDPLFSKPFVDSLAASYLGSTSAKDPAVDLLQADYSGLPPMIIQAGADETLVDDSHVLDGLARRAGVESHLEVFPGQLHSFQMAAGRAPVADEAIAKLATWAREHLLGPATTPLSA
jgi:epsilon-lactone hydrolase